ncbi:DUF3107 domain-containing protein [Arthrobacter sp. UM1]|uniref:DUF3107 domain-containing protein n=1 Tax=Arthrobacter sp. UM1 TaxID=2766776 RepID=UPI001CF7149A|nr:DUF3107 domain-containing protein [Arthrobacter sp. UM1]MCB4207814.1 DUF3107 domain-containing protein [Arthrobacter sp. UM1]
MDIKIGMENVSREVSIDAALETEQVLELVNKAIEEGTTLQLKDRKGQQVLVPGSKIAYVEIGQDASRPVGFGAL